MPERVYRSPVTGKIPRTKASDAERWCFFDLRLNERLSKQSWGWWFETPSRPLWRHSNGHTGLADMWAYCHLHNKLRSRHNGRHFEEDVFKCVFFHENWFTFCHVSLKFVSRSLIDNILALVQIMAWRWIGGKPSSEPMGTLFSDAHICVTPCVRNVKHRIRVETVYTWQWRFIRSFLKKTRTFQQIHPYVKPIMTHFSNAYMRRYGERGGGIYWD